LSQLIECRVPLRGSRPATFNSKQMRAYDVANGDVPGEESSRVLGTSQMRKRSLRGVVAPGYVGMFIHDIDRTRGDG